MAVKQMAVVTVFLSQENSSWMGTHLSPESDPYAALHTCAICMFVCIFQNQPRCTKISLWQ